MRSKKVILGSVALAATTGFLLVGNLPLSAQSTETWNMFGRVAQILNLDSDKLSDAFKQAYIENIQERIDSGQISAERGQELIDRINEGDFPFLGMGGGPLVEFKSELHDQLLEFLNLSDDEFRNYKEDGKTLLEIAKAQGISEDELKDFLKNQHEEMIDNNTWLSDERKKQMKENFDERIDEMINNVPGKGMMGGFEKMKGLMDD